MKIATTTLALVGLLAVLPSCATLFQPGPDLIHVSSEPSGAKVRLDGLPMGTTPCMVIAKRSGGGLITISKAGYLSYQTRLRTSVNWTTFLNLLWWPGILIGLPVDGFSGNFTAWEGPVHVLLLKQEPKP
jgi:hypothetical protein